MKKLISTLASAALLLSALALSGCNTADTPASSTPPSSEPEISQPQDSSVSISSSDDQTSSMASSLADDSADAPASPVGASGLADSWESMEIALSGVVYKPGNLVSDYINAGWLLEAGNEGVAMGANTSSWIYMTSGENGKNKITVSYVNETEAAIPLEECLVTRLKFGTLDLKDGATFELPGGLTETSTLAEVDALYGEPTDSYVDSDGVVGSYTYKISAGEYTVRFNSEGILNGVEIWYRS